MIPTLTVTQYNQLSTFQRRAFNALGGITTGSGVKAPVIHGADESAEEKCFTVSTGQGTRAISAEMSSVDAERIFRSYKDAGALPEGVVSFDVFSTARGRLRTAFSFSDGGEVFFFSTDHGTPTQYN